MFWKTELHAFCTAATLEGTGGQGEKRNVYCFDSLLGLVMVILNCCQNSLKVQPMYVDPKLF